MSIDELLPISQASLPAVSRYSWERNTMAQSISTTSTQTRISRLSLGMLAFLFTLGAINFADKMVAALLAVPIIKEFHLTPTQWGILSGSFFWLFSLSSILIGTWSDTLGTKRTLSLLATVWTFTQLATAIVTSFPLLLLTRVGLGAGEGPYTGVALAAASRWLPEARRGLGVAIVTCGNLVGPALLTPVLVYASVYLGWRSAFILLGACSLLWLILWHFLGKERPEEDSSSETKQLASGEEPRIKKISWSELRQLLFSRNVIFITLAAFGAYWFQAIFLGWLTIYFTEVRHLTLQNFAIFSPIMTLTACTMQILFSGLGDRLYRQTGKSRSYVYVLSFVLIATAIMLYGSSIVHSTILSLLLISCIPNGAAFALTGTLILNVTPVERHGTMQGITIALAMLAGVIGPTLAGPLIQAAGHNLAAGFNSVYLLTCSLLLACALAGFIFIRPDEQKRIANREAVQLEEARAS
ncbi:MFS transporter [Ktedonosporobacter rubrisoli]|uniref:MFS transporter n=1 Tax=Ktedonosporobacter rubrisoli TaxID=2509675 RepID=A0A4P6JWW7_KTERU|nr:MFS transporter [Ktedonosporobacter rubrisoli]QBD80219.1 MFS transporter [Ktedonosporobacter rubrisoli]